MSKIHTIALHPLAPDKPRFGDTCNGCGVCCAAKPCPVTYVFLWQRSGACRALVWQAQEHRYACGMVLFPDRYVFWIPARFSRRVGNWMATRIAAGDGCDSDLEIEDD